MLGSGKTGTVRGFTRASQDADLYRRYAAGLCRQALLTRGDPASAEQAACDVIVNENALARMAERGENDARYRPSPRAPRGLAALLHAVMRRLAASSAAAR